MNTNLWTDAWTVTQKELRELLSIRSGSTFALLLVITVVLFLGIIIPLQAGPAWLDEPWLLGLWAWFPVLIVAITVTDSVAGERERHTLETLLASRLPDRAIVLGKVMAAVLFGWGIVLVAILTSIIAINVVYARDTLLLYRPLLLIDGGLLSLLTATLAASIAVLISLRTESVRRAQAMILTLILAVMLIHSVGGPLIARALPFSLSAYMNAASSLLENIGYVATLASALVVINAILLALAISWFRRDRLNLR